MQLATVKQSTTSLTHVSLQAEEASADELLDGDDLSPDGPIAQRIRAELAAHEPLDASTFRVADTGDAARGRGLYVSRGSTISSGCYLFDYEGEILDQQAFDERYPAASAQRADYAVGLLNADGSSVYVDGADPTKSNVARFMNHVCEDEANVVVYTVYEPKPRVMLFAACDIESGAELRFYYGKRYWEGRDDQVP